AVRNVSWQACVPHDTATISLAVPASFRRIASSTAISSKGFIDILTLAVSTPEPSALTRTLTLKSTTRLTGTRIFMLPLFSGTSGDFTAGGGQNRIGCGDRKKQNPKKPEPRRHGELQNRITELDFLCALCAPLKGVL